MAQGLSSINCTALIRGLITPTLDRISQALFDTRLLLKASGHNDSVNNGSSKDGEESLGLVQSIMARVSMYTSTGFGIRQHCERDPGNKRIVPKEANHIGQRNNSPGPSHQHTQKQTHDTNMTERPNILFDARRGHSQNPRVLSNNLGGESTLRTRE